MEYSVVVVLSMYPSVDWAAPRGSIPIRKMKNVSHRVVCICTVLYYTGYNTIQFSLSSGYFFLSLSCPFPSLFHSSHPPIASVFVSVPRANLGNGGRYGVCIPPALVDFRVGGGESKRGVSRCICRLLFIVHNLTLGTRLGTFTKAPLSQLYELILPFHSRLRRGYILRQGEGKRKNNSVQKKRKKKKRKKGRGALRLRCA